MASTVASGWPIKRLLEEVEEKYRKKSLEESWKVESGRVEDRLRHLSTSLSAQYQNASVINIGGAGIVLKAFDSNLNHTPVAIKLPRPVAAHEHLLSALLSKEIGHLITARHPGIVRIHRQGSAFETGTKPFGSFVYLVMDFVEGRSADEFLATELISEEQVLRILLMATEAFLHLHEHDTLHFDIKAENLLLTRDLRPVVADLGTAKRLATEKGAEPETTTIACTPRFAHKVVHDWLRDTGDKNRWEATVERTVLRKEFDLPPFGYMILEFLGFSDGGEPLERKLTISPYTRKYLLLMAARSMCGAPPRWLEEKLGLSHEILNSSWYEDFDEVLYDLRKLAGQASLVSSVPELNNYHPNTIQIASDSPTTYTPRLADAIDHPALKRLASISQLGLVSLVYRTATHSRLEHSLGTYHNACHFVRALDNDPLCPLFRQLMRPRDVTAVLLAALLHDLGQFPLAHDLEDIDPALFNHKRLTQKMLAGLERLAGSTGLFSAWDTERETVERILSARPSERGFTIRERILHGIIDGPVDADKLDYLSRDTARLKLPYGNGIDVDRILRSLTPIITNRGADGSVVSVGVHEKAKVAAELVAVSRAAMFSQAYWHHAVRAAKAMLARSVQRISARLQAGGDADKTNWRDQFEGFVCGLPGALFSEGTVGLDPSIESDGALGATDVSVLAYLLREARRHAPIESPLLEALIERRLFKRIFVFAKERSPKEWDLIANRWASAAIPKKVSIYEELEQWLERKVAERVRKGVANTTTTISDFERLQSELRARVPILLIDVPAARPGADVALHYVIESQRRALRKEDRVVGQAAESSVSRDFGLGLRDRAGKVRVYCHPDYIDAVEASIEDSDLVEELSAILQSHAI